jgi:hypothetical protein
MKWSYDYKNRLPMNHFAFCDGQGICRFPIFDIKGNLDPIHLRNALSRLPITELPDEKARVRIKKELEKLLIRMNAGERITAKEWTPITTTKLFANGRSGGDMKYEQKISKSVRGDFSKVLHTIGAKPVTIDFNLPNGRKISLTAVPPTELSPVGYIDGRLKDKGGRTVSHYERINDVCGDYQFVDGETKIALSVKC